jgi:hypothetical protein
MANLTVGRMKPITPPSTGASMPKRRALAEPLPTMFHRIAAWNICQLAAPPSAIVRSQTRRVPEKDGTGTARGLAIKLLDVVGTRAVANDGDSTQDFVMIDHPVLSFPYPKAYLGTSSRKNIPLIGDLWQRPIWLCWSETNSRL